MRDVGDDLGVKFTAAIEDLSGAWKLVQEAVLSRLPLRNVVLKNKFGNPVVVDELDVECVLTSDPRLQRLRHYSHSPVTWFRNPFALVITVSTDDVDDYKRNVRGQVRAALDEAAKYIGSYTDYIVLYVRPQNVDPAAKGPKKVFEFLRHDFSTRRREHCVRIDLHARKGGGTGASPGVVGMGLEDLDRHLRDAIRTTFEGREAAYEEEIRRMMATRLEPSWCFPSFFLVKDSLAVMLEAGGLAEDALREYSELEATYLEALAAGRGGSGSGGGATGSAFAPPAMGGDSAALLDATWREVRRMVLHAGGGVDEFYFRQYLFSRQARLLLKLERPAEVAERGLQFLQSFSQLLAAQQQRGEVAPGFGEAWAFSACIALATAAASDGADRGSIGEAMPRRMSRRTSSFEADSRPAPAPSDNFPLPPDGGSGGGGGDGNAPGGMEAVQISPNSSGEQPLPLPAGEGLPALKMPHPRRPASSGGAATSSGLGAVPGPNAADWGLSIPVPSGDDAFFLSRSSNGGGARAGGVPDSPKSRARAEAHRSLLTLVGTLYATARTELMRAAAALEVDSACEGGLPGRVQLMGCCLRSTSAPRLETGSTPRHQRNRSINVELLPPTAEKGVANAAQQDVGPSGSSVVPTPPPLPPSPAGKSRRPTTPLSRFHTHTQASAQLGPGDAAHLAAGAGGTPREQQQQPAPPGTPPRPQTAGEVVRETNMTGLSSLLKKGRFSTSDTSSAAGSDEVPPLPQHAPPSAVKAGSSFTSMLQGNFSIAAAQLSTVPPELANVDIRQIEREVESVDSEVGGNLAPLSPADGGSVNGPDGSGDLASPFDAPAQQGSGSTASGSKGGNAGGSVVQADAVKGRPPNEWVSDWRLKTALETPLALQELYMQLSFAAAQCFSLAGRARMTALLRADVADVLLQQGNAVAAAALYEREARLLLQDGWTGLASQVLTKLAQCHKATSSPGLVRTCVQLLALSTQQEGELGRRRSRAAVGGQQQQPKEGGDVVVDQEAALRDLLDCSASSAAKEMQQSIDALDVLQLHPIPGHYSRFFGVPPMDGGLSLPRVLHGGTQARAVCVGDVVIIPVRVSNQLRQPLRFERMQLTLALLQDMEVAMSPGTADLGAGRAKPWPEGGAVGGTRRRSSWWGSFSASGPTWTPRRAQAGGWSDSQFGLRWGETEELQCALLPQGAPQGTAGTDAATAAAAGFGGGASVELPPGPTTLHFVARPLKRGVYALKHVTATLGGLRLRVPTARSESLGIRSQQWQAGAMLLEGGGASLMDLFGDDLGPPSLGSVDRWGWIQQEAVVLEVQAARQRVELAAALMQGSLVAGQQQWLGLVVRPLHDRVEGGQLRLAAATTSERMRSVLMMPPGGLQGDASVRPVDGNDAHLGGGPSSSCMSTKVPAAPEGCVLLLPQACSPAAAAAGPAHGQEDCGPVTAFGKLLQEEEELAAAAAAELRVASSDGASSSGALAGAPQGYQWIKLHGNSLDLPAWAADRPCLVWFWMRAGPLPLQHEVVRVNVGPPRHAQAVSRGDAARALARTQTFAAARHGSMEVEVNLEYSWGCLRSHASLVSLGVRHPFLVASQAREMGGDRVQVQVLLRSQMVHPVVVRGAALLPQQGLEVVTSMAEASGLLPATVQPGATILLAAILRHDGPTAAAATASSPSASALSGSAVSAAGALGNGIAGGEGGCEDDDGSGGTGRDVNLLEVHYDVLHLSPPQGDPVVLPALGEATPGGAVAAAAAGSSGGAAVLAAAGGGGGCQTPVALHQSMRPPAPPAEWLEAAAAASSNSTSTIAVSNSTAASNGGTSSAGSSSSCSGARGYLFRHLVSLEMYPGEASPSKLVFVRLLGPFQGEVGQPLTLTWRLERAPEYSGTGGSDVVLYDVAAQGGGWQPGGKRAGSVTLAAVPGAAATVEASWVPVKDGALQVPELRLRNFPHQEVFDVGQATDSIMVGAPLHEVTLE